MIVFDVPGTPVPKGSLLSHYSHGKIVTRHASQRLAAWQRAVSTAARWAVKDAAPLTTACRVQLDFTLAKPKRPSHAWPRLDLDKLTRAVLDALTGIAYLDDSQVTVLHASKSYAPTTGVRVGVWEGV